MLTRLATRASKEREVSQNGIDDAGSTEQAGGIGVSLVSKHRPCAKHKCEEETLERSPRQPAKHRLTELEFWMRPVEASRVH